MENQKKFSENKRKSWISLTGYRTLFVLKLLIEKNRSLKELIEFLQSNEITNKSLSKDTVRLTINTLRMAGCKIDSPEKTNGYKYVLTYHPFHLYFSEEELNVLLRLRDSLSLELPYQDVFVLNDLFQKIIELTNSQEKINLFENTKALLGIDKALVDEFEKLLSLKRKVQICYDSPANGEENIDIIPKKITYENGNLYLLGFNFKYKGNSLFSFSRIKKINMIYMYSEDNENQTYEVVYKLSGPSMSTFEKQDYETILSEDKKEITVKAMVENEFSFVQRLLLFGADFKIVSPHSFKEKLIEKIKRIQRVYKNDEI